MDPKLSVPTSRISLRCNYIKDNSGVDESLYMLNMGYKVVNIDNKLAKTCQRVNRSRVKLR